MDADDEIKRKVENAIAWNCSIDRSRVKVSVKNGRVMLEGHVSWEYQRSKARLLAEDVIGVVEVVDLLHVDPQAPDGMAA